MKNHALRRGSESDNVNFVDGGVDPARPERHRINVIKLRDTGEHQNGLHPWIIRAALNTMQAHSEETVIVGDNLRTDILAGFQAGLERRTVRRRPDRNHGRAYRGWWR